MKKASSRLTIIIYCDSAAATPWASGPGSAGISTCMIAIGSAPVTVHTAMTVSVMPTSTSNAFSRFATAPEIDTRNMQLVFPENEVSIGTVWNNTLEPNLQVPVPLKVKYKVLSFEKIKGFDCVKISSTVRSGDKSTIEGLSLDVKADGYIYFAYKHGKMIRNEVKSSMRMILKRVINNQPQSIITKMTMNMKMEHQF